MTRWIEPTGDEPPPPVPPGASVRHFNKMQVDLDKLEGSRLERLGDPAGNWYAFRLWRKAFHEVPAGSAPNDVRELAVMVGLDGKPLVWRKYREWIMRNWRLHADGRLYHETVTETVLAALKQSRRGKAGATGRWGAGEGEGEAEATAGSPAAQPAGDPRGNPPGQNRQPIEKTPTSNGSRIAEPAQAGTAIEGDGKGREENPSLRSGAPAATLFGDEEPKPPSKQQLATEFEQWYRDYPLHEGRGAAEAAFGKARKIASFEMLLAGATRYRLRREREDGGDPGRFKRFTAHPSTWLNQKRWLDEEIITDATKAPGDRGSTASDAGKAGLLAGVGLDVERG